MASKIRVYGKAQNRTALYPRRGERHNRQLGRLLQE